MSQDQRDQEYRLKSAEHAFGPKEPEILGPPKPSAEQKKVGSGEPGRASKMVSAAGKAAVDNPLVDSLKATVGGVQSGGKSIADAIVPPPSSQAGAGGRAADAGLGALDIIMSGLGVHGGAAFFKSLIEHGAGAGANEPVAMPARLHEIVRSAQEIFGAPQSARAVVGQGPEAKAKFEAETKARTEKPVTYGELAEFLGGFAGPMAAHAPGVAKGAEPVKPGAAPAPAGAPGFGPGAVKGVATAATAATEAAAPTTAAGARAATATQAATNIRPKGGVHEGTVPPVEAKGIEQAPGVAESAGLPGDVAEAQINAKNGVVPEEPVVVPRRRSTDAQEGVVTEPAAPAEAAPAAEVPGEAPILEQPAAPADAPAAAPGATNVEGPKGVGDQPPGSDAATDQVLDGGEGGEAAAGVPQVQDVTDLHEAVAPAAATYGPPDAATVKGAKERGIQIAQEMRAQGANRNAVREALRANLNESGLFSENQLKRMAEESSKTEAPPVPSSEDLKPEHIVDAEGPNSMNEEAHRFADEYMKAKTDPAAKPAWDALARETDRLYSDIEKKLQIEQVTGQPYPDQRSMNADIAKGILKVSTDNNEHPLWTPEENLKFRVVHDYYAHQTGDFSLAGERQAYLDHAAMLQDPLAKQALQTEVYGQAAAYTKTGAFQEQKAFLSKNALSEEPDIRQELVKLKNAYWDLHDKVNALLGIDENTIGGGVPMRGDLATLGEAGKAAQVVLNQMQHVGAAIILKGAKSFKAWSVEMRKEFGDLSDEVLKALFPKAQASLSTLQDQYPQMLTPKGAQAAFTRGQKGALWYDKAPDELAAQYGPENVHMAADVYAATSINTNAATVNIDLADKAIKMILSGERDGFDKPFTKDDGVTAGIAAPQQLIKLNQIARGEELTGAKIGPYSNTLKGIPKGVDAAGNMVFEPVLDTWMGRGFGFAAADEQWSPTEQQRAYVNKVISDIAAKEGVQPQEVQAAMWVDFKTASDLQKLKDKPKWKTMTAEQRQEAVDKINKSNGTPFDQLLQNRLGPSIRAAVLSGDTGPTAAADYLGRKVIGGLIEDQLSDPTTTATLALQEAGLDQQTATPLAARILQSLKDRMNSTDPEGARFNQTNMGFNPLDLFNIFRKNHDLAQKPFDMDGAREALTAKADELKINDALHLDLGEAVGPTESKAAADAHLAAKAHLADVLDRVINGAGIEEGELHHAAALTGAAAEKTRVADIREGSAFGRRTGGPAVKPITEAVLGKATERLAGAMSEPELAGWLKGLGEDYKQSQWLANNFRAAAMDTHGTVSPQGLWHLMMANMVGAQIAGPSTLIKSLVSHGLALPYAVAVERGAEAFGKYWPDQKGKGRVVPGSAEQLKAGIMGTILDTWKLYSEGDQKALTAQAEQVGELHLPVPNASTPFDNIINMTLGLPGSVLSRVRAPARVGLTRGFLNVEALAQATREAELDPTLKGDKYDARVVELQASPSVEMLKNANEGSDKWSFTTPLKGMVGAIVQNDAARIVLTAFARIDMSLMKHAVESNPLTGLYSLGQAMREGGPAWDRARAKYALGASAYLAALTLASQGLVTGPGPTDPRANEQWVKDGHQPDSIWNPITEKWQSHRYIPILSGILSTAGQSMAIFNDANVPDLESKLIRIAWAQGNMLTHSSLANAFADLAKAISNGFDGKEWANLVRHKFEAMGGFLTEGPVKQLTDYYLDGKPVVMPGRTTPGAGATQTELEKQWAMVQQETTLGQWASWDQGQPLKRDHITGEKIQRPGMFGYSVVNHDPVAHVFSILGSDQRGLKYALPYPKQTIGGMPSMNNQSEFKGVELSNWEYDRKVQFQTEAKIDGKTLHEALADLIETKKFKDAMDEADTPQRRMEGLPAIMLRQVYSQYETTAENKLLAEDKHLQWLVNVNKTQQQALAVPHSKQPQLPPEPEEQKYPRPGQIRD